ncbi:MAG: hypothetical protein O2887_14680 [Bacteroidetes bacterium]|nr:hypothetical protein [Bacteroidota bacterium]MDA1121714.1 hypothetical protein [Bacteroidota bacterium]
MSFALYIVILLAFFGLMWYIVQLLINKKSVKFASIAITAFCGFFMLYFFVFAYIKASEADRQAGHAQLYYDEAQKNANTAQKQTEIAEGALADAHTQQRLAQEAIKECQNSK